MSVSLKGVNPATKESRAVMSISLKGVNPAIKESRTVMSILLKGVNPAIKESRTVMSISLKEGESCYQRKQDCDVYFIEGGGVDQRKGGCLFY